MDIKNIKSRVDCWVDNNTNQINNIKKVKKIEDIEVIKQKDTTDNYIDKIELDFLNLQKSMSKTFII